MRLLAAFLSHELRLQSRSLRFRLLAISYVVLSLTPAVLVAFAQRHSDSLFGGATYAQEGSLFQPALIALLSLTLSLDGMLRERGEGQWSTLGLAPLSNARYFLLRWTSIAMLVLGLTIMPVLGTIAIVAAVGAPPPHAAVLLDPWLLESAPVALLASALGLATGTIAGSELAAVGLLIVALMVGPSALNTVLARQHRKVTEPAQILGIDAMRRRIVWYQTAVGSRFGMAPVLALSEGADDGLAETGSRIGDLLPAATLALVLFAIAPAFLQRCRRDLAPWRIAPNHPLRSTLLLLNRARQTWSPDAGLAPADRWCLGVAPVAIVVFAAAFWVRDDRYRSFGNAEYAAEVAPMKPTPTAAVPRTWRVDGSIDPDGKVALEVDAEIANVGTEPVHHLAFMVSPLLEVEARAVDRGALRAQREWDRLGLELDPALSPWETRHLHFQVRGVPAEIEYHLSDTRSSSSFALRWHQAMTRLLAADLSDLSASWLRRAVSPRRIDLSGSELLPVPRYSPWTLTPPPAYPGGPGLDVPSETISPEADVRFRVSVPAGDVVGEPCGHLAGGTHRIEGACHIALDRWGIVGSGLQVVSQQPYFAALPAHRQRARLHLETLSAIVGEVEEAWPQLGLQVPLLFEWPPPFGSDPWDGMGSWSPWATDQGPTPEARGRILLIPEFLIARTRRISAEGLVAELVSQSLLHRRAVAHDEMLFLQEFLKAIVRRRLGLGAATGAVLIAREPASFEISLTDYPQWYATSPALARLDAVVADLEHRVGVATLRNAIEAFLAHPTTAPGTVAELMTTLASSSGVPLDAFEKEELRGKGLPQVGLEDVRAVGRSPWRVSGSLHNSGTAEAWCTVVVETESEPLETNVRVAGGQSSAFTIASPLRPRRVTLDPDQLCLRFHTAVPGSLRDRVDLHLEGGS